MWSFCMVHFVSLDSDLLMTWKNHGSVSMALCTLLGTIVISSESFRLNSFFCNAVG